MTSILNVCFYNNSLPLAFAFGRSGPIYLYDFLENAEEKLNISFNGKFLESDEGKALYSICEKYSMIQLSYLRHFLEKLKKLDYFYEIKLLLKFTSQFEFESNIQHLSTQFTTVCKENPNEYTKINKILEKQNEKKKKKVSLLYRVETHMPSTTNTLEAMHGHINDNCPRRSIFIFCNL